MTREEREDAINCFKNKLENEVFGAKYNKLALEALEQAPILDKIRAEMFEEMQSHSGTGEEVIQAYADGLKKGLDILDKYKTEVEITPQFSSGLDKKSKELEKDFGESDCIIRDSAIKALDYDIKCFEFKPGVSKHMDDIAKLLNTIYETQVNNLKTLPSVPQIRSKGHWYIDERPESNREVICSNCEQPIFRYHELYFDYRPKYCPNCGAKMESED